MRQRVHQADHVLRGFRYQLLHALQVWIDLRPDQELLLEIDEDHAVVSAQRADSTQIKFSDAVGGSRAISLRSSAVIQAIERYWHRSQEGTDPRPNLIFLTNSTAAREQGANFPEGKAGLVYWKEAAQGSDLSPLRTLLAAIFKQTLLGEWLRSNPSDGELRSRLLKRVEFVLDAPDDFVLQSHIRERLGMIFLAKGHYETAADTALPVLLDKVFAAASSKDIETRRLSVGDLHRAIEESLPRMGSLVQAQLMQQARPATGVGVTALQLRAGLSDRSETVAGLTQRVAQEGVVYLYGPNGIGKSTLAKLLANSQGGSWLVCDFRPFLAEADSRGAVGVWRELMSALASEPPPAGIILDDISARGIDLLKSRLAGLAAASKIRGAFLVITSNHTPSSALLAEIGTTRQAAAESPYFTLAEIRELVEQDPAPKAELVEGWTNLIHVSTSGGHPLLVMAKVANLRARGWPDQALVEDIGPQANEGVKGTKVEARKRLLAELPPDTSARAVLERVSAVFQSFDDGLVQALCYDPPPVQYPSDALVLLKGSWLEPVGDGAWRLSPLLSDLTADVPKEQAMRWRQIAAEYWLSKGKLDAHTLPLCFWNAYLGRHLAVLMKVIEAILTLEPGQVQSATAMLSPLAAFRTDQSLLPEEPMLACNLRLLQVVVADAIEDEKTATAATEVLLHEIDAVPVPAFRELEISISAKVVLGLDRVWIPARTQVAYLRRLKETIARAMSGSCPELKEPIQDLTAGLPKGTDVCGVLLAGVFMRLHDSEHLSEMIDALAEMEDDERSALIQSVEAVLEGLGTFIHNAWANEQLSGKDLSRTLGFYDSIRERVARWKMPDLEAELAIAQSVILDEGLEDRMKSLEIIDTAIEKFGKRPALIRQKIKVLRHQGSKDGAAALLIEIEGKISELAPFDQGLALRDGAVAAADVKRYDDALRLFDKAEAVFAAKEGCEAISIGVTIDGAMVLWELGQRGAAIRRAGDALEAVEKINPLASQQNLRAHRMARAAVGLFMYEVEPYPDGPRPPIAVGMGSMLEDSERPEPDELTVLSDNWRILEATEADAGVDGDIARRSAARQGPSRLVSLESTLAKAHFANALEVGDIDGAVRAIVPALSLLKHFAAILEAGQDARPALTRADIDDLKLFSVVELVSSGWLDAVQHMLVDIMMSLTLSGRWTADSVQQLRNSVSLHWKSDEHLKPLLDALSAGTPADGSKPMAVLVATSLRKFGDEPALGLRDRVQRDLYWIYQAANSPGRRALEPAVVRAIADGWTHVLEHQRFMLSMPMRSAPTIEAAVKVFVQQGLRAAPQLIEAAAEGARVAIPPQWRTLLDLLGGKGAATS